MLRDFREKGTSIPIRRYNSNSDYIRLKQTR
jgi:hypothetical protein